MSNEIITLVKDTSLARIIALQEIIWAGQAFMKGSQGISGAIWPLFFCAFYYLIWNGVTVLLGKLEKKLDFLDRRSRYERSSYSESAPTTCPAAEQRGDTY